MKAILSISIFALVIILCSNRTKPGFPLDGIRLPVRAQSLGPIMHLEPDTLFASVGGVQYTISTEGAISWGNKPVRSIRLNTDAWIGKIFLDTIDKKYLLAFYEEDYATDGAFCVEKINMLSRKRVWLAHIPSLNLGQPYIKGRYAYINGWGMVGKLNLATGSYVYKYDDLYQRPKSSFMFFDSISFKNNLTYFYSRNIITKRVDTVIVDEAAKKLFIRN